MAACKRVRKMAEHGRPQQEFTLADLAAARQELLDALAGAERD
jgi:hypothetical protein